MTDQREPTHPIPPVSRTDQLGFATRALHGGEHPRQDPGARALPIYLSAGFVFEDADHAEARFAGTEDGFTYSRVGNPTVAAVEDALARLEGGVSAVFVASGQAALTCTLLSLLNAGDHILVSERIYEGTRGLILENLARLGMSASFVPEVNDPASWAAAIRPRTRALFVESIANPTNEVADIATIAAVAHEHGIPLIVDNTFATPYLLRPFEWGADIVLHSTSKLLSGHGTAIGGAIIDGGRFDWSATAGRFPQFTEPTRSLPEQSFTRQHGHRAFIEYARGVMVPRFGPTPSPFSAFILNQGLETLAVRVERQSASALRIARWLARRPEVASVDYCGLDSHSTSAIAERQLPRGSGSVFSVTLSGGEAVARTVHDRLRLFTRMTHLGDVRSLVIHPTSTTHTLRTPAERAAAGIHPGTLRLSIGLEDADDLIADLDQALVEVPTRAGTPDAGIPGGREGPDWGEPDWREQREQEPRGQDPGRQEPSRQEPSRQEPSRQEPSRQDPGRQDPGRQEPSRQDPGRQERRGQDPGQQERRAHHHDRTHDHDREKGIA